MPVEFKPAFQLCTLRVHGDEPGGFVPRHRLELTREANPCFMLSYVSTTTNRAKLLVPGTSHWPGWQTSKRPHTTGPTPNSRRMSKGVDIPPAVSSGAGR